MKTQLGKVFFSEKKMLESEEVWMNKKLREIYLSVGVENEVWLNRRMERS